MADRPARPGPDAEEAEQLVERCDGIELDGLTFSLAHVWRGEAILRISGGADERVTDSDAFFRGPGTRCCGRSRSSPRPSAPRSLRGVDA